MQAVRIVSGTAVPLDRSDVDTDQIIPAEWLKRVERTGFGKGLFSAWRDDRSFVLNDEAYAGATILIAGNNFGTGSSREHAVWAIMDHGFQAVIAPRFADIFRNNCTKNGLIPVQVGPEAGAELMQAVQADPRAGAHHRRRATYRRGARRRHRHRLPLGRRHPAAVPGGARRRGHHRQAGRRQRQARRLRSRSALLDAHRGLTTTGGRAPARWVSRC